MSSVGLCDAWVVTAGLLTSGERLTHVSSAGPSHAGVVAAGP